MPQKNNQDDGGAGEDDEEEEEMMGKICKFENKYLQESSAALEIGSK